MKGGIAKINFFFELELWTWVLSRISYLGPFYLGKNYHLVCLRHVFSSFRWLLPLLFPLRWLDDRDHLAPQRRRLLPCLCGAALCAPVVFSIASPHLLCVVFGILIEYESIPVVNEFLSFSFWKDIYSEMITVISCVYHGYFPMKTRNFGITLQCLRTSPDLILSICISWRGVINYEII